MNMRKLFALLFLPTLLLACEATVTPTADTITLNKTTGTSGKVAFLFNDAWECKTTKKSVTTYGKAVIQTTKLASATACANVSLANVTNGDTFNYSKSASATTGGAGEAEIVATAPKGIPKGTYSLGSYEVCCRMTDKEVSVDSPCTTVDVTLNVEENVPNPNTGELCIPVPAPVIKIRSATSYPDLNRVDFTWTTTDESGQFTYTKELSVYGNFGHFLGTGYLPLVQEPLTPNGSPGAVHSSSITYSGKLESLSLSITALANGRSVARDRWSGIQGNVKPVILSDVNVELKNPTEMRNQGVRIFANDNIDENLLLTDIDATTFRENGGTLTQIGTDVLAITITDATPAGLYTVTLKLEGRSGIYEKKVYINVVDVSTVPAVAKNDAYTDIKANTWVELPVTGNDSHPYAASFVIKEVKATSGTPTKLGVASDGKRIYFQAPAGTYTLSYTLEDSWGNTSNAATVTVTVLAADPTVTTFTTSVATVADDHGGPLDETFTATCAATDPNGGALTYTLTGNGTITATGTGTWTVNPNVNATGNQTYTCTATNASAGSGSKAATVFVQEAPWIHNDGLPFGGLAASSYAEYVFTAPATAAKVEVMCGLAPFTGDLNAVVVPMVAGSWAGGGCVDASVYNQAWTAAGGGGQLAQVINATAGQRFVIYMSNGHVGVPAAATCQIRSFYEFTDPAGAPLQTLAELTAPTNPIPGGCP